MTLVIGVLCTNGIVLGADGARTMGLIRQPVNKLHNISDSLALGIAGEVGNGQVIKDAFGSWWGQAATAPLTSVQCQSSIRNSVWPVMQAQLAVGYQAQMAGVAGALDGCLVHALAAFAAANRTTPTLVQLLHTGGVTQATPDMPFFAIGSGATIASPFLAFVREVLWQHAQPNINQGQLATLWALQHTIRTTSGGVGDPVKMMLLHYDQGTWRVKELTTGEIDEHRQSIAALEQHLRSFQTAAAGNPQGPGPPPP